MKYLATILLQLILSNVLKAQTIEDQPTNEMAVNLVANGSFEDKNICTESEVGCAPEAWFYLPVAGGYTPVLTFYPKAKISGTSFGVLTVGDRSSSRTVHPYMYTKLLCGLEKNKRYNFSLWIFTFTNPLQDLGVMLTDYEPQTEQGQIKKFSPTFILNDSSVTEIKQEWKKINYSFIAKGNEVFLTIGTLKNKSQKRYIPTSTSGDPLYLIDDIWLYTEGKSFVMCNEYYAVRKQLYDQNFRHTVYHPVSKVKIDSSLFKSNHSSTSIKKIDTLLVIVDTPPIMKPKLADTLIIPDILFQFNSSQINQSFRQKLDSTVELIREKKYKKITIRGYTDDIGSIQHNQELSLQRATTIKRYIVEKLVIDEKIIEASGAGEREPIASNDTPRGRQKNRRVEIILTL